MNTHSIRAETSSSAIAEPVASPPTRPRPAPHPIAISRIKRAVAQNFHLDPLDLESTDELARVPRALAMWACHEVGYHFPAIAKSFGLTTADALYETLLVEQSGADLDALYTGITGLVMH